MFTDAEIRLLNANNGEFPLLVAAKAAMDRCNTCGHKNVNVHSMLRVALNKYKSDKRFIHHLSTFMHLPCSIAGVYIDRIQE